MCDSLLWPSSSNPNPNPETQRLVQKHTAHRPAPTPKPPHTATHTWGGWAACVSRSFCLFLGPHSFPPFSPLPAACGPPLPCQAPTSTHGPTSCAEQIGERPKGRQAGPFKGQHDAAMDTRARAQGSTTHPLSPTPPPTFATQDPDRVDRHVNHRGVPLPCGAPVYISPTRRPPKKGERKDGGL